MPKKYTVKINGFEYQLPYDPVPILEVLTFLGFYFQRDDEYFSFEKIDNNSLHLGIETIYEKEEKNAKGFTPGPPLPKPERTTYSSAGVFSEIIKEPSFLTCKLMLEMFSCVFCGLTSDFDLRSQISELLSSKELAEGSYNSEADRNDLGSSGQGVKKKMKKPVITNAEKSEIDLTVEKVSREWRDWSAGKYPYLAKRLTVETYYRDLMKAKKYAGMSSEQIEAMFQWIKQDDFWRDHAIAPKSLLTESKNGMKKLDNILTRMRNSIIRENPFLEENWENPFV